MQHGIAWHEKINLQHILQKQHFSILVDVDVQQVLAVVVRYFMNRLIKLWILYSKL